MNPELRRIADQQGGVVSSRQAAQAGYTREQIRERLADGRWRRVRYGQYADRVDLGDMPPWERQLFHHKQLVHAAINSMRSDSAVVSHHSALVLHGVPVWGVDLSEVQLTRTTLRTGSNAGVRHHRGLFDPADLTEVDGLMGSTVARAVAESAACTSLESGVVSVDAALRDGRIAPGELDRLVEQTEFWPGGPAIRAAFAFANPLSESVGESRMRVLMHNQGLPPPILQATFENEDGFIGRTDFFFVEEGTIVEFDGLQKYADGSREGLIREKVREDRLRALGFEVVRTTWADLNQPPRTARRIREGFARARAMRRAG
ncbi:type IV toxin-antitoxin system AbiEi family antitoxin domain-containing protein [Kribbella yunnanensis]|uniref:type IV toxin-antitoxin system AbiEi family antitoxin domain-containing protein n=1 Tax=Kribbella yunnanensis TaxID=190194 RepID=UPI0031CE34D4